MEEIKPRNFREERLDKLFDECSNTIFEQIIQPFGLSMAMFNDKDGGGVDTIHNARSGVYANDAEKEKYDNRPKYDSVPYHRDKEYRDKNAEVSKSRKKGELIDGYTGNKVGTNEDIDLDHIISAKQAHDDPGAYLSDSDINKLVNNEINLTPTNRAINRSKGAKSIEEFTEDWKKKQPERQIKIEELSNKSSLTEKEHKDLQKLKTLEGFSPEEASKIAKKTEKQYEKEINKYYGSNKFAKSATKDAAKTAVKTAIQQTLGKVLIVFAKSSFHEMKMFVRERSTHNKNIYEDIKNRLTRVMNEVIEKLKNWKEIVGELKGGFLSGFLSSLVTTLVNIFATTAKRFVRAIREGIRSLIEVFKLLVNRPTEMTEEEAFKIIIKTISGVFITTVSIVAETSLNTFLQSVPIIGQFASILTPVLLGILSGISIALVSYIVDEIFDIFNKSSREFDELLKISNLQFAYTVQLNSLAETHMIMAETFAKMIDRYDNIININDTIKSSNSRLLDGSETIMKSVEIQCQDKINVSQSMQASHQSNQEILKIFEDTEDYIKKRKAKEEVI